MHTVLFVHGTGTRDPGYSLMLERVRASLSGHARVEPCYWGEAEGSRLRAGGASIPQYESTRAAFSSLLRAAEPEDQEDYEIALWELLQRQSQQFMCAFGRVHTKRSSQPNFLLLFRFKRGQICGEE
jgi:hypothetical protein